MIRWRRLLPIIICLLSAPAFGQTLVSGVVKDSFGTIYSNCSWSINFVGQNTTPGAGPYLVSGSVFNTSFSGNCDSSANLVSGGGTIGLYDNINSISPTPSQWQFNICSATGYVGGNSHGQFCFTTLITITGASQSITTPLTAAAPTLPSTGGTASGVAGQVQIKGPVGTFNGVAPAYAAAAIGGDCGAQINAQEAALGATAGEIIVDAACKPGTWSPVVISNNNHTLRCAGPTKWTFNTVTLSGNYDTIRDCYLIEVTSGLTQNLVSSSGNYNNVLNNTVDGNATMGSTNGTSVDAIQVTGKNTLVEGNHVLGAQGFGISIVGTATSGPGGGPGGDHNKVVNNWTYGCNYNSNNACIFVGNLSNSAGAFANWNQVIGNHIDCGGTLSGDGIFVTAHTGSLALSNGTQNQWNQINFNEIRNCLDSPIELGEGSYHDTAEGNIISSIGAAAIVVRDATESLVSNNLINIEPAGSTGIGVIAQRLAASYDTNTVIKGNSIKGYFPATNYGTGAGIGIYANQAGAHIQDNDIQFTAGVALVQSLSVSGGTATLITNKPLDLPNSSSIIITNTTNFNSTFTLLSVNDLTNTYTFSHAAAGTETSGNVNFVPLTGIGLQGTGIALPSVGPASAVGNRIKLMSMGIDVNPGGGTISLSDFKVTENWINQVGTGINLFKVTCTNCDFAPNHITQVLTTAVNDSSASGSSTSFMPGNSFSLTGWSGAAPNESNSGYPNFLYSYLNTSGQQLNVPIEFREAAACPAAISGFEILCADPTLHAVTASLNGGAFKALPQIANDLGGTSAAPTVLATHLSSPLPLAQGGSVIYSCGTVAANGTCANTSLIGTGHGIAGIATLAAGTSTLTGISPAFTSSSSWFCTSNDVTTITNPSKCVPASASTLTCTGTGTDNIVFTCEGN